MVFNKYVHALHHVLPFWSLSFWSDSFRNVMVFVYNLNVRELWVGYLKTGHAEEFPLLDQVQSVLEDFSSAKKLQENVVSLCNSCVLFLLEVTEWGLVYTTEEKLATLKAYVSCQRYPEVWRNPFFHDEQKRSWKQGARSKSFNPRITKLC